MLACAWLLAVLRVGIVGLDTSHAVAFAKAMNVEKIPCVEGLRVVAAHQWGSRDIVSATNRYPRYIAQMRGMGVEIVPTLGELLARVDCVCLETNDGREHLRQAEAIFRAGKPVFIDKPLAHNLREALKIHELGKKHRAKCFSTSSLRYSSAIADVVSGKYGAIRGMAYAAPSPMEAQGTHGRYSWYGIHGFEPIVAVMGTGADTVRTVVGDRVDAITVTWKDGRVATLRATQDDWDAYGGVAFPEKGKPVALGGYEGYGKLLEHIAGFFRTGVPPVPIEETLDVMAMIEAAEMSVKRGGAPVTLSEAISASVGK